MTLKKCHLSPAHWLRYDTLLLGTSNITVKRCNVLNPATLLPVPINSETDTLAQQDFTVDDELFDHDCLQTVNVVCTPVA